MSNDYNTFKNDMLTPGEILDSLIADQQKASKKHVSGQKRGKRAPLLLLMVFFVAVLLATVWMGIGLFMKFGILPWVDFGYTWLDGLFGSIM